MRTRILPSIALAIAGVLSTPSTARADDCAFFEAECAEDAFGEPRCSTVSPAVEICCNGSDICCALTEDGTLSGDCDGRPFPATPFALSVHASTGAVWDAEVKGDAVAAVLEMPGLEVVAEEDQVSWCWVDGDAASCGHAETKWGCQYFPEEGPADDIAVCILTTLAEHCCECLSVCPDDEEDESGRPAGLPPEFGSPTGAEFPGCTATPLGKTSCSISCDNGFFGVCTTTASWECGYNDGHGTNGRVVGPKGVPSPCEW